MDELTISVVKTRKDLERFIQFRYDLYRDCPYDAPCLHFDEVNTFSKKKNAAFEFCEADYFIAERGGRVVGRVAAIINRRANERWQREAVRFGWFDFIDDTSVSEALLKTVAQWGRQRGMKEIVGPLGFTDMDPEGMMYYGFDQLGTMATGYNYDYYPRHMEQMQGWQKDNDYVEYKLYVPDQVPEKLVKISEMIKKRYHLGLHRLTRREILFGDIGMKAFDVVNKTFGNLYGYSELSERQKRQYVNMYFPFLHPKFQALVEDQTDPDNPKLVGVGITLPSLSRALQQCKNGRLLPFGWWHVVKALFFYKTEVVDLLLIGVLPEYRAKGANALLFSHLIPTYQQKGFKWGETHVEMETNEKVQSQWAYFDHEQHKRRRCYRKEI
ncbi:MAG: N-acetyltransferase [Prevotella sp.]|nr:N-acetyltransferase [Prevotella sp.]